MKMYKTLLKDCDDCPNLEVIGATGWRCRETGDYLTMVSGTVLIPESCPLSDETEEG